MLNTPDSIIRFFGRGIRKDAPNPLEELLVWARTAVQTLFPSADELLSTFVFDAPPPHIEADYSFPTFSLGASFKQDPSLIANTIATFLVQNSHRFVKKIYAAGPYVNIEVEKELYCEKSLEHILNQEKKFGSSKITKPTLISINHITPDLSSALSLNGLRMFLVGKVIGRCYEIVGDTLQYNYYVAGSDAQKSQPPYVFKKIMPLPVFHYEDRFDLESQEVIGRALKSGIAKYISNTKAIVTVPSDNTPSLVLQKNDESTTSLTNYLAYIKYCLSKKNPSTLISIYLEKGTNATLPIFEIARQLEFVSPGIRVSVVSLGKTSGHESLSEIDRSLQYEIFRTPLHNGLALNSESNGHYLLITNLIKKLKTTSKTSDLKDAFPMVKLLASFPVILSKIRSSHEPAHLTTYLEEVVSQCEEPLVTRDRRLAHAVSIVLENGLKLLSF